MTAMQRRSRLCAVAAIALATLAMAPAYGEMSAEELAKLAQNPVGNLISLPFQNNTNLRFGPEKGTQNILNIQPVIPISVNNEWNVITRTIVPVVSMPPLFPGDDRTNGLGDTQFTAFLSPASPGKWIWGAGPILQIPTARVPFTTRRPARPLPGTPRASATVTTPMSTATSITTTAAPGTSTRPAAGQGPPETPRGPTALRRRAPLVRIVGVASPEPITVGEAAASAAVVLVGAGSAAASADVSAASAAAAKQGG
jgi:hypothetical protein